MNGRLVFHSGSDLSLDHWTQPPPPPFAPSHGVYANGSGFLAVKSSGSPPEYGELIQNHRLFRVNSYSYPVYADTWSSRVADRGDSDVACVVWNQADVWRLVFCYPHASYSRRQSFGGWDEWWIYVIDCIVQYGSNAVFNTGYSYDILHAYESRRGGDVHGSYAYHSYVNAASGVTGHNVSSTSVTAL